MSIQVNSSDELFLKNNSEPAPVEPKSAPSAKEPKEQKEPSSESETEETEAKEASGSEDESESHDDSDESKDSEEDKPKKKGGFQRRIDKLNAKHAAAQQEVEYWKSQALKDKAASEPKEASKVESKSPSNSDDEPDPEHFESHKEYVKAVTKWTINQDKKATQAEAERSKLLSEQEKMVKSYQERVKSFSEKASDFQEVIESVDDIKTSVTVQQIILNSDNGPELAYELAKNPDELKRISALPPLEAARAMGRLESKLASNTSEEKTEPKKLTNAPKPIEPVGSSKSVARKSIDDPGISQAEYERLRREQMKRRGSQ